METKIGSIQDKSVKNIYSYMNFVASTSVREP